MLLAQKATAEGGMALCHYAADLVDQLALAATDDERKRFDALLALLTPVVKSWPSMHGLDANHYAIQVLGGYGYTRDYPVERLYRDNRLNEIHEGTTGIQSLDLLDASCSRTRARACPSWVAKSRRPARLQRKCLLSPRLPERWAPRCSAWVRSARR